MFLNKQSICCSVFLFFKIVEVIFNGCFFTNLINKCHLFSNLIASRVNRRNSLGTTDRTRVGKNANSYYGNSAMKRINFGLF